MTNGKQNRKKGHRAEQIYAGEFRKMGFDRCVTSRFGSKQHDNAGIDLINLPFNVQIKAGLQRGFNASSVLQYTKEETEKIFSKDSMERKALLIGILHKQSPKGKKKTEYDQLVFMTFKDFKQLINKIKKWD